MTLVERLDYRVPEPNAFQRAMWKISSSRPGAWLFARTMHHLDKLLLRLTGGRVSVPRVLAGIPVITLVTTGARTGVSREMPLLGVPHDGNLAVIGTRFGQRHTPGWYFNLGKHPDAEVRYQGRSAAVTAREAEGPERDAILAAGRQLYAGYEAYMRRIRGRTVHVMVLEDASAA